MVPQIGKLLRADEQLIHQTTETFATVSESDLNWTEKVWASIARRDGTMQVDFGIGRYHNRNVMDGFAGVSRGDTQWTARASRELWRDPDRVGVGPIDYEIVEPLKTLRFRLGTGLYMGYDGQKHGMWRGRAHEDGERISPVTDPRNLRRMHQLRDSILRVREGDAVGHGILESVAVGPWPQFGLTAQSSFL